MSTNQPNDSDLPTGVDGPDAPSDRTEPRESHSIELQPGKLLWDRYVVDRLLSRGGMGVVYVARDTKLDLKPVVVKFLRDARSSSDEHDWLLEKFKQEMRALSRIDHPGVVVALDYGETPEGTLFLVMQFVQGSTLRSEIRPTGSDLGLAASVVRQIGRALTAAHDKRVFHRDLKPENVMLQDLGDGEYHVKLIDFGLATVRDTQFASEKDTAPAGTAPYMAPEQFIGRPSAASDVYALGVMAYELVTGRCPFVAKSSAVQYPMQMAGVRVRPSDLRSELPAEAEALILQALSFDEKDRPGRAREFGDAFARAVAEGQPHPAVSAASPSLEPRATSATGLTRKLTRIPRRARWGGVAVALVAVCAALIAWPFIVPKEVVSPSPTAATAPAMDVSLTVQRFRGRLPSGAPFRLAGSEAVVIEKDTGVRLNVAMAKDGYFYVVNEGPEPDLSTGLPQYTLVFPMRGDNGGTARVTANQTVEIPPGEDPKKDWIFVLDNRKGTEKLWLVLSASPVELLEGIRRLYEKSDRTKAIDDGATTAALRQFLSTNSATRPEATQDYDRKQTIVKGTGDPLVYPMRLEHQ